MSQAVQLAKAAREKLASALNALQTDASAPDGLMEVAEPIAQSMGVLHRIERSGGADLEGRDKALDAVRRALDLLQKIEVSHPAVDACLEAVAASLSKVHGLTRISAEPAAAAAPAAPPAAPAALAPTHQQIPRPVASSPPPAAAPPAAAQPASVPRPNVAPQPAPAPAVQPVAAQPVPVQPVAVQPVPIQPVAVQPVAVHPAAAPAPVAAWPPAVAVTPAAAPAPLVVPPAPAAAPPAGSQGPSGTQVMASPPPPTPAAAASPGSARMQGGTLMMQKSPVDAALAAQAVGTGFPPVGPTGGLGTAPTAPAPQAAPTSPFPQPAPAVASPVPQAMPGGAMPGGAMPGQAVQAYQAQPVQPMAPTPAPAPAAAPAPARPGAPAGSVVVELGAHSASNFYKGLSGNDVIEAGGIFVGTYKVPKLGTQVQLRVLLPGDYEFHAAAVVQWVREAGDGVEPGFGAKFTQITPEGRQLVYRYARNREPIFYDDL